MRISIFGLGYVGTVSLGCLAQEGHQLIGVDINPDKLALIKAGQTPIIEAGMQELIRGVVDAGRVEVTRDAGHAIAHSDVSFVCVGTPSLPNGDQDQSAVLNLAAELGRALRSRDTYHLVVFRSTLKPGSVQGQIRELIEKESGKQDGVDFDLCFQPEFLREGSSIRDYENPPMTIVGTDSDRAAEELRKLFGHLPCEFITTDVKTAETVKYFCNIFHALKITFANEVGRFCHAGGIDPHAVMSLLCQDTHLNISAAYLRPGFAFGGSCLPKDLRAVAHRAKMQDVEMPVIESILASNRLHLHQVRGRVLGFGKKKITMVGLSFKSGTDDLRESPLVDLAEFLIGKGMDLCIHDPEVELARLTGANRQYIESTIPHISSLMSNDLDRVLRDAEVVILGLSDKNLTEQVRSTLGEDQILMDLVQIDEPASLSCEYHGACW